MEQNREPTNKPMHKNKLILDKDAKNTQWGKGSLFRTWHWKMWIATCKGMKLDHIPYAIYTKTN